MKKIFLFKNLRKRSLFLFYCFLFIHCSLAFGDGFNANWVDIVRLNNGKYRVIIKYTHVEIGEFREAHVDFDSKEKAIDIFQKLAKGADFFFGDIEKTVHFHSTPEKNTPY
ncbi:MAG: hypothetical protein K2X39_02240 [Silvanigrellaceae bacterium]|nr:hypothetical protein [Silvanigrellaceae bacterium]